MRFSKKWVCFFGLTAWLFMARADQEKLPEEFFTNAELYARMEMIEQLTVLDNISDKDIMMAQAADPQSREKLEQTP